MLSWSRKLSALIAAALVPAFALGACQPSLPGVEAICSEIPAGGCPTGRGGSCDDESCKALYTCLHSTWRLHEVCHHEGGAGGSGPETDAGPDAPPDAPCTPFSFDHHGEAPHCTPDLENPDCPSQAAEGCVESACLTSCLDFFLCTKEGWVDVAYCDDEGVFHDTQKQP